MKKNIGSIRALKGKWQIYTYEKGFRPGWRPFNKEYVLKVMKTTPLKGYRDNWINLLNEDKYDELKEAIKDAKDVSASSFLSSMINTLSMAKNVNFKKDEVKENGDNSNI